MIAAWRIVKERFADDVFSGEGARLFGGRWNKPNHRVVYTAASCTFPEVLVEDLDATRLPKNWRDYPAPAELQQLVVEWLLNGSSAVISVPSAVTPEERNYLINPEHEHFRSVDCGQSRAFKIDLRLLT
ncbi:MAG TPA: RES family NAD+ phosphorylase [Thermoanaerobaculia bacterium]